MQGSILAYCMLIASRLLVSIVNPSQILFFKHVAVTFEAHEIVISPKKVRLLSTLICFSVYLLGTLLKNLLMDFDEIFKVAQQ